VFVLISVSLAKTHQLIVYSVKVTIDGQMFPHVIALKVFMILASLIVNPVTQYVKIVLIHLLIVLIVWEIIELRILLFAPAFKDITMILLIPLIQTVLNAKISVLIVKTS
jgi:hypothetical protein